MLVRNNASACPFQALYRPMLATALATALEPGSFRIITPDALLEPFLSSSTRESLAMVLWSRPLKRPRTSDIKEIDPSVRERMCELHNLARR